MQIQETFFSFGVMACLQSCFALTSWDEVGGNLERCLAAGGIRDPKLQV